MRPSNGRWISRSTSTGLSANHSDFSNVARSSANLSASIAMSSSAVSRSRSSSSSKPPSATPVWAVLPFCLYLLLIATLPLFLGRFWEHNRNKLALAVAMSVPVVIYVLGFPKAVMDVYIIIVGFHAVFNHANVRLPAAFGRAPLKWLIVTPDFHHWHHSSEQEALDRNFAVHTPLWDLLFGTYYLPDRWPAQYGVHGRPVPSGWLQQFFQPFKRSS